MQLIPLTGTVTPVKVVIIPKQRRMQLIPLTRTVTPVRYNAGAISLDATHTPHGDGNRSAGRGRGYFRRMQLIPLTGTVTTAFVGNNASPFRMQLIPLTGTVTLPYVHNYEKHLLPMQLIPLTGTVTPNIIRIVNNSFKDATHTPHGDGNLFARSFSTGKN